MNSGAEVPPDTRHRGTVALVRPGRPPTVNKNVGGRGLDIQRDLAGLYVDAGGMLSDEHCYGLVYYFVRNYSHATDADAGNVSKRIWDALQTVAYADDHVVRFQSVGVIEIGPTRSGEIAFESLDVTDVPQTALQKLLELIDGGMKHVIYVEIGPIRSALFAFNLSQSPRVAP